MGSTSAPTTWLGLAPIAPEEKGVMHRLPRPPAESIFAHGIWHSRLSDCSSASACLRHPGLALGRGFGALADHGVHRADAGADVPRWRSARSASRSSRRGFAKPADAWRGGADLPASARAHLRAVAERHLPHAAANPRRTRVLPRDLVADAGSGGDREMAAKAIGKKIVLESSWV